MNQCANLLGYTHIVALFVNMVYINNGKTKQATINLVGCYARTWIASIARSVLSRGSGVSDSHSVNLASKVKL